MVPSGVGKQGWGNPLVEGTAREGSLPGEPEGNISSDGEPALGWSRNRAQYCSGDAQKDSACPPGDHISRRCPLQKCSYI